MRFTVKFNTLFRRALPMPRPMTRRDVLQASLAGGAILALPAAAYRAAFAGTAPSETIRLGFIGVGAQGTANMKAFLKLSTASVVALSDVDAKRLSTATGEVEKATTKAPAGHADYRKLLDDKTIDAVVVGTPDHWHALNTIDSCKAGKDVYCEKPLSLTVAEGRAMVTAAEAGQRVVQTGSQQRSGSEFRTACELVRAGAVGKVHTVKVGLPGPNFKGPPVKDAQAPAELDYDRWLGPAPARAYNEKRVHYLFRFFWDYSGGQQTNFGAHHYDIAQWGLGKDSTGPVSVRAKARFHKDGWYEVPEWTEIEYLYADGVKMLGGQGFAQGTEFIGDKGSLFVTRGSFKTSPVELKEMKIAEGLPKSPGHHANWLACIKSRSAPIADISIGHRSATVCHLGNIAVRTGKTIRWNPETETIVDDAESAKLLTKEYRAPWKL